MISSFVVIFRVPFWEGDRQAAIVAVRRNLPYIDWLKISDEEADFLGSEAEMKALVQSAEWPSLIVITLGAKGAKVFFADEEMSIDGIPAEAVDTTGAGDAFWGGFLSSLYYSGVRSAGQLEGKVIETALRYGTVSGWLCVQKKGAIASLPGREQILQEIERIYG